MGGTVREAARRAMYNSFYHFTKEPFNITPDPAFLYQSPTHQEALATIVYGIENRKAFILITGEVGTGKTSILRAFLQGIKRDNIHSIYIINPNITFREFLEKIFRELEVETEGLSTTRMVEKLHRVLVDEYLRGKNFVVVIDEAQNMPIETMESMRLLSNLETSTYKLIQIVFAAPPEFEEILDHPRLKSLKQRIAVRARIQALSAGESAEYIQHRLSVVSTGEEPAFTKSAIKMIAAKAQGIPRVINVLCDAALVSGLGYHEKPVDAKIVREVIADYKATAKPKDTWSAPRWAPIMAGFTFLLIVALFFMLYKVFDVLEQHKTQLAKLRQPIVRGKIDPGLREQANIKADMPGTETVSQATLPSPEGAKSPDPFGKPGSPGSAAVDSGKRPAAAEGKHGTTGDSRGARKAADVSKSDKRFPVKAIVKKDDTLFRMTVRVYGFSNDRVINFVKRNNPAIKDISHIEEGSTIVFPPLDESLRESNYR
jgi:general secretion pathway protein A